MMRYTTPDIYDIPDQEIFQNAFSQYSGPAFLIFDEACPGVSCGTDKIYEQVQEGQYQSCFQEGGPPEVGSVAQLACQNGKSAQFTFEANQFEGVSSECPDSDPNLWTMTISFSSAMEEDCVVTHLVISGRDYCEASCPK